VAGKFRTAASGFMELLEDVAAEHGWRIKSETIGQTEGGAGTLTVKFVPALDGDEALNGTPMGQQANGRSPEQRDGTSADELPFGGFAAPRAHRPGAEQE
jgi:hypothetical protein